MTSNETVEKINVQPETAGDNSSDVVGEALGSTEKISEIVGESASENVADTVKNKGRTTGGDTSNSKQVSTNVAKQVVLPSVNVQRKKVAQVLMSERKVLLKALSKIEKQKGFSAYKTESVITQLRSVQKLLSEILIAAKERIEQLYRQYVLGK